MTLYVLVEFRHACNFMPSPILNHFGSTQYHITKCAMELFSTICTNHQNFEQLKMALILDGMKRISTPYRLIKTSVQNKISTSEQHFSSIDLYLNTLSILARFQID